MSTQRLYWSARLRPISCCRYRRTRRRLCGGAHAADVGFPRSGKHTDPHRPVALSSGVRVRSVAAHGGSLRGDAGLAAQAAPIDAVRNSTRTTAMGASVLQRGRVVVQVGLSLVLLGRGIDTRDTPAATTVAVVNQTFVRHLFKPGENPIGRHFGSPGPDSTGDFEIVGVVEDTVYTSVREGDHLMYFVPMMQRPKSTKLPIEKGDSLYMGSIVLGTDHPMNDMEKLVRATLDDINPNLTVEQFQTFDQQISDRFTEERMLSRLSTLFGALALQLAIIGLYGVTAYSVVRRTPEIGIRMALGAERGGVIAMVMRGAMIQAALGLAIGIPVALLCVRFVKSQLYEITRADFSVMAGAIVILGLAAFVAGIIPARRAASIDPVRALRME